MYQLINIEINHLPQNNIDESFEHNLNEKAKTTLNYYNAKMNILCQFKLKAVIMSIMFIFPLSKRE